MKRVLIVTDAWHPQVNGVVTVFDAIIPILKKRGVEVRVAHPGLFKTVPLPTYSEIRIALFPHRHMREIIEREQPDAIHIATEGPLGFAARSICRKKKIPFTTSFHTNFQHYVAQRLHMPVLPLVYAVLRRFHGGAVRTMTATESMKKELEAHGFRSVVLWPLGVDTDLFKRNMSLSPLDMPRPIFLYFGRIAPEKSVEEFLALDLPGTKLVIGDGPSRTKLESEYGNTARFLGYQKGQALVDWVSRSDVFVCPSRTETFGLTIIEALACGVPVAAHNVTGPKEIITNGVDGILDEDLGRAAREALKLNGDACRVTALRYSWSASTDAFVANLMFKT